MAIQIGSKVNNIFIFAKETRVIVMKRKLWKMNKMGQAGL